MMQTVLPSEFKRGMVLMVGGAPEVLEEFHFSGTAQTKTQAKLHARLRHLKTGRLTEHTFAESERVPIADTQYRRVQFSYHHGENYAFSDVETFEELTLSAEQIGERRLFIKENEEYRALFIDSRLVDITVPTIVTLEVVDAAGPIRGGSDAAWKPARLDTGLEIMVPLFIAPGEKIRVDTTGRKYAGRENEARK
jgi:elongation factor P